MGKAAHDQRWTKPDNALYSYIDGSKLDDEQGYHPHVSTRFINYSADASVVRSGKLPQLYSSRSECCGCSACMFVCPTSSILMKADEEGFDYPVVDVSSCIGCSKCLQACIFKVRQAERNRD